jgi:hypothetical protein
MLCHHLRSLEAEIVARGIHESYRGRAWMNHCREWVYFDCYLDAAALRNRLGLADCVQEHINHDPRSGQERGFVCIEHEDGIMGLYSPRDDKPIVT